MLLPLLGRLVADILLRAGGSFVHSLRLGMRHFLPPSVLPAQLRYIVRVRRPSRLRSLTQLALQLHNGDSLRKSFSCSLLLSSASSLCPTVMSMCNLKLLLPELQSSAQQA